MPPSLLTSCASLPMPSTWPGRERADDRLRVAEVLHRLRDLAALDEEEPVAGEPGDDLRLRVEDAVVPEVGDEQPPLDAGDELLERLVAALRGTGRPGSRRTTPGRRSCRSTRRRPAPRCAGRGRGPTVTPSRTRSTPSLRRALGVVGAAERARVGAVVPQVDPLVELLLAEVGEAGALGVGLAVEAEPGGEQQHRRHRLRLEHHLVGAGVELDRVGAVGGLGRRSIAHRAGRRGRRGASRSSGRSRRWAARRPPRRGGWRRPAPSSSGWRSGCPVVEHSTWVSASVEQ